MLLIRDVYSKLNIGIKEASAILKGDISIKENIKNYLKYRFIGLIMLKEA